MGSRQLWAFACDCGFVAAIHATVPAEIDRGKSEEGAALYPNPSSEEPGFAGGGQLINLNLQQGVHGLSPKHGPCALVWHILAAALLSKRVLNF